MESGMYNLKRFFIFGSDQSRKFGLMIDSSQQNELASFVRRSVDDMSSEFVAKVDEFLAAHIGCASSKSSTTSTCADSKSVSKPSSTSIALKRFVDSVKSGWVFDLTWNISRTSILH